MYLELKSPSIFVLLCSLYPIFLYASYHLRTSAKFLRFRFLSVHTTNILSVLWTEILFCNGTNLASKNRRFYILRKVIVLPFSLCTCMCKLPRSATVIGVFIIAFARTHQSMKWWMNYRLRSDHPKLFIEISQEPRNFRFLRWRSSSHCSMINDCCSNWIRIRCIGVIIALLSMCLIGYPLRPVQWHAS